MPALKTPYPRLSAAATQDTIEAAFLASPDDVVKSYLLSVTSELLAVQSSTISLGAPSTDRYSPSLQTLHDRLRAGYASPFPGLENRNKEGFNRVEKASRKATVSPATDRPLGDFEDLYYAILATVKEMHEAIILRLNNGFSDPNAVLFPTSQFTIHFFQEWLVHQWTILNEPSLVLALDDASRKSFVEDTLCRGLRTQVEDGEITQEQAEAARAQLYRSDVLEDMPGLSWVGNEHSAMINGRLNEKYRVVFQAKKEAREKKQRWAKKKDRIQKTAKTSPKPTARRGSGEYRQQQHSVSTFSIGTEGPTPRSETTQAEQGCGPAWQSQRVDQTRSGMQSLSQEEVQAWRLYTQQHMSAQREVQLEDHERVVRRKTSLNLGQLVNTQQLTHTTAQASAQATTPALDCSHHEVNPYTPHAQQNQATQPRLPRMLRETHPQHVNQDGLSSTQEHATPGASPRGMRAQRVTAYQAWLRESASDGARWVMGQPSQIQPGMSDASLQELEGMDVRMDVDDGDEF
ncbi:uncharacterized protein N0V89_003099 [Didymosphaeria variabile]|uniref:Uncharacterized protein n=1 Tax=Didymosphaeria variabile TaxID=1932322 RepID=A0A9W8XVH0_9PLEO|nr:uncharacterized protein N0V89_003099 [Didymosphaeria variabile]KAJ4358515.1 hypothetical protein N0V89_003099 [Didymosphaeria variabile]